jgi:hypothetical protein
MSGRGWAIGRFWWSRRQRAILFGMSDQGSDDDQTKRRMDALLLKLLKTPPQSRAEVAEAARRAKAEAKATRAQLKSPTATRFRGLWGPHLRLLRRSLGLRLILAGPKN